MLRLKRPGRRRESVSHESEPALDGQGVPDRPQAQRSNPIIDFSRRLGGASGDWTLLALGFLAGGLAFLWAGYLVNPKDQTGLTGPIFTEPWSLYGFFCLVMLTLEASILLDRKLHDKWKPSKARVVTALIVTALWIVAIPAVYFGRARIVSALQSLLHSLPQFISQFVHGRQLLFMLANLVCVIALWLGVRFFSYDPEEDSGADRAPFPGERFAGDLVLSACCSFALAWVFFAPFWQAAAQATSTQQSHGGALSFSTCDMVYVAQRAPCTLQLYDTPTLFFLNAAILPAIYIGAAMVIVGYAAWHEALVTGRTEDFAGIWVATFWNVVRRRVTIPNLLLALRYTWPLLLLLATLLAGIAAKTSQWFLYNVAHAPKWWIFWVDRDPRTLGLQVATVAALLVALLATISAATVQIVPRTRRAANLRLDMALAWRHIRFWADMLAQSYWFVSIVFSLINLVALWIVSAIASGMTGAARMDLLTKDYWSPFAQPDPLALLSFAWFMISATRRGKRGGGSRVAGGHPSERGDGDHVAKSLDARRPPDDAEIAKRAILN
jgi:hypothetical protein